MPEGIIVKGIGGFYYVNIEEEIFECKARGLFRKNGISPIPGDRVEISIVDDENKIGNLEAIRPRSSQLIRPSVANIDQIAIVTSIKSPDPDFMLIDKLLITAEQKGIKVIICINKIDLVEKNKWNSIVKMYDKANYETALISCKKNIGFSSLENKLKNRFTAFAGQSGVGKSTILNKVLDSLVMETGGLSSKINRGKHTTRHAQLLKLKQGGYVVDTPGFSSFELNNIDYSELELYYPEFKQVLNQCKFTGCSHITEPKCKVKELVDKNKINIDRYERYVSFYNLLKEKDKNKYR